MKCLAARLLLAWMCASLLWLGSTAVGLAQEKPAETTTDDSASTQSDDAKPTPSPTDANAAAKPSGEEVEAAVTSDGQEPQAEEKTSDAQEAEPQETGKSPKNDLQFRVGSTEDSHPELTAERKRRNKQQEADKQASTSDPKPTTSSPAKTQSDDTKLYPKPKKEPKVFGWDLMLEVGAGFELRNTIDSNFFGRMRTGLLWNTSWLLFGIGPTGAISGISPWSVGGQIEAFVMDVGVSMHVGAAYAKDNNAQLQLGLTFAIFGLEWQHFFDVNGNDGGERDALFFTLRAPLGAIFFNMI